MKKVIGMLNLAALPGSYMYAGASIDEILESALSEAKALRDAGFDSLLIQNMADGPQGKNADPAATSAIAIAAREVKRICPEMEIGILIIWDGVSSLAAAVASGADFIRVEHGYTRAEMSATGMLEAQCMEILEKKRIYGTDVKIYADIFEPHGAHMLPCSFEDSVFETVRYSHADGIFVTGKTFAESIELGRRAKRLVPDIPVFIGGGVNGDNAGKAAAVFDGICIGSWIKNGSLANPVDQERANFITKTIKG